jgi:hypothetical protein
MGANRRLPCVSCQKRRLTELAARSGWQHDAIAGITLCTHWWLLAWVLTAPAFRPSLTSQSLNVSACNPALAGAGACIDRKSGRGFNSRQIGGNHPMQNRVLSPAGVSSSIVLAKPDCPLCKMGMRPVQAMPVLFSHDLDEVVYVCDECGQRTKRTLKRL